VAELIHELRATPIPTILVVFGLVLLAIAAIGKVGVHINPDRTGRILSGVIGAALLMTGLVWPPGGAEVRQDNATPRGLAVSQSTASPVTSGALPPTQVPPSPSTIAPPTAGAGASQVTASAPTTNTLPAPPDHRSENFSREVPSWLQQKPDFPGYTLERKGPEGAIGLPAFAVTVLRADSQTAMAQVEGIYRDVSISVRAWVVHAEGNPQIALGCRRRNPAPGPTKPAEIMSYRLLVSVPEARFLLQRFNRADSVTALGANPSAGPTRFAGLKTSLNETNRLELSCRGSTIEATINDISVDTKTDNFFDQGQVWIGVQSPGGAAEVRFTDLVIDRLVNDRR
jgi:hypothetical protein